MGTRIMKTVYPKGFLILLLSFCAIITAAEAPGGIRLAPGQSQVYKFVNLTRVATSNPAVVDVKVLNKEEVMIMAKGPGLCTVQFWTAGEIVTKQFEVVTSVGILAEEIEYRIGLSGVRVSVINNTVLLEGEVNTLTDYQRAEKIAGIYTEKVVNLIRIAQPVQVLMQVQVLELRKDSSEEFGFNWGEVGGDGTFMLGSLTIGEEEINAAFTRYYRIITKIKALVDQGKAKVLAVPSLLTQDGKTARFHAGGEFPYTIPQEQGKVLIVWKEYGVILKITPLVHEADMVEMQVAPEVSELDWSNSITVSGYEIPGFRTRKMETSLSVKNGTTIAMGGLLNQSQTEAVTKVPVLGEVPVLGPLFRSRKYVTGETELVLFVTPFIVTENQLVEVKKMLEPLEQPLSDSSNKTSSTTKESEN